jgi:catechol 2,3-dioxygenase-like lactoylglutathione lyase family enzyme
MPRQRQKAARSKSGLTFNHAMVYVHDVARALPFYRDLLGFKVIEQFRGSGSPVYARLRSPSGRTTLALHQLDPGQALHQNGGIRLYFEVKNLEKFCRKLAAAGVRFLQPPKVMPWGWKHAYLRDPDGHELSLYWAGQKRFRKTRM